MIPMGKASSLNAGYVKSFIFATGYIVSEMIKMKLSSGKPYFKNNFQSVIREILTYEDVENLDNQNLDNQNESFNAKLIAVNIGFTGNLNGNVVFTFRSDYAKKVLLFLYGFEVEEFDEMALSALRELCNMISGYSLIHLNELTGQNVDIMPPEIIQCGDTIVADKQPVICIPFQNETDIVFEINCGLH